MITADLLRNVPLLAQVPDAELEVIAARAADIELRTGDWLIQEGEIAAFFIVISGGLDVFKSLGGKQQRINHYGPGAHSGELPILLGAPAIASLQATVPSRICRLDQADFRELIVACPLLNAQLLEVMASRVNSLQQLAITTPIASVTIIGHRFDVACHAMRDFLTGNHVAFRWYDPRDPATRTGLSPTPQADERFPVVQFADGSRLVTPSFRQVATRLDLQTTPSKGTYDVGIIGGGPAGLAAAVYAASEGLRTILVERDAPGGQAGTSSRIENYLGFPAGVSGDDLGARALQQAQRFGTEILVARQVAAIAEDRIDQVHRIFLDDGAPVECRTIVVATGVTWRELEVPGADTLIGRGVYYGAARTEALGVRGQDIFLIGAGNSAGQAAMFFADYARSVTLLVRGASLATRMSHYLIVQLSTKANIRIEVRNQVVNVEGTDQLEAIVVENRDTGERRREETRALFVFIGADAETSWLPPSIIRDRCGYVCTGRDVLDLVAENQGSWPLDRDPYLLETSMPGVFAVGDVRHASIKRVASAVGEGSMAVAFIHRFLAERATATVAS